LACNTATISALSALRKHFTQIPFVGTVPAIKPAAKTSSNRKIGVLGTSRTIEEIHSLNLVDDTCEIIGIAAPELVEFVEHHFEKADEEKKTQIVKKYIDLFRAEGVDSLVLGCTHFLFLLEEFKRESANPVLPIEVFDSLEGITKRIEFLLDENDGLLRAGNNPNPKNGILLTEKQSPLWQERANNMGFSLNTLE